jgi:hypothetical protein
MHRIVSLAAAIIVTGSSPAPVTRPANPSPVHTHNEKSQENTAMIHHAKGTFDVRLVPLASDPEGTPVGRMSNDKRFHGDIDGTSRGQMLMIGSTLEGSAAYVSIEVVTATLAGRSGSFALQHNGIMRRGVGELAVTVVPDSGTGGLAGLDGRLAIDVQDGVHAYTFAYTLPMAE